MTFIDLSKHQGMNNYRNNVHKLCNKIPKGTVFQVSDVKVNKYAIIPGLVEKEVALKQLAGGPLKRIYGKPVARLGSEFVSCEHQVNRLFQAVQLAFMNHLPLVLSPDIVWLCIAQNIVSEVNDAPEEYRKYFVSRGDEETLKVHTDDFLDNSERWTKVVLDFDRQVKNYANPKIHEQLVCNFSTSKSMDRVASGVVLMNLTKKYFKYTVKTHCGIPFIRLMGTVDDWLLVKKKIELFKPVHPKWIEQMLPLIDQFVESVKAPNNVDRSFWQNIYNIDQGSGSEQITGWIKNLFPGIYDKHAAETKDFVEIVSKVPVDWYYGSETIQLGLCAGFVGVMQYVDGSVRPEISWCIASV
jgi:hypothetical protein